MGRRYYKSSKQEQDYHKNKQHHSTATLHKQLDKNVETLENVLDEPNDLVIREFSVSNTSYGAAVAFIDGLVNEDEVYSTAIKNVQLLAEQNDPPDEPDVLFEEIYQSIISQADVSQEDAFDDMMDALLYGYAIFYLDGCDTVLAMDVRQWEQRGIEEPQTEQVVRGPKEGFIENMRTNMALIRRYIRDPNLRFDTMPAGRRSKSNLVLAYIDGIINPDLVKEIKRRLDTIDMDQAIDSSSIEQWVEDSFMSPFPQMTNTERPDRVASSLMKGKFALILDGTPYVLVAPVVIGNAMQSMEDYYERWSIGTILRTLRYAAAFIAVFLPALYIALVAYQPGMIPSRLAFSIAATREGVPFPAFVEAVLMVVTMELLREGGARLPTMLGDTIGIVGGLVIGEAAVQAGIVSPIMVIIVALNALASFAIPQYSVAISFRIILFGYMIAAAIFGIYGIILAYIMTNIHIVNLHSMGIPYSTPFAPFFKGDWKDLVLRLPIPMLTKRPKYLQTDDQVSGDKRGDSS